MPRSTAVPLSKQRFRRRPALVTTLLLTLMVLPLTAAPASAADPTPGWLSGMSGDNPKEFAAYRGSPVEIVQGWTDTPDVWLLAPGGPLDGYRGPLSISMTLPSFTTWRDVARGEQDAVWRTTARTLARYRRGAAVTYVSPFWEFNGDWSPYSVQRTDAGKKDFRDGFARLSKIMRREFPGVKILLDPHCHRSLPRGMRPPLSSYDVEACTSYNSYGWTADGDWPLADLEDLHDRARRNGKPMAVTEWGNAGEPTNNHGGGDAPVYIDRMHAWAKKYAGKGKGDLIFETYFNIDDYALVDGGQLNPNMPRAVREYARKF